jgi:hypothetical protein
MGGAVILTTLRDTMQSTQQGTTNRPLITGHEHARAAPAM